MMFCVSFLMITRWLPQLQTSSHTNVLHKKKWTGGKGLSFYQRGLYPRSSPQAEFPSQLISWNQSHGQLWENMESSIWARGARWLWLAWLKIFNPGYISKSLEWWYWKSMCAHVYVRMCISTHTYLNVYIHAYLGPTTDQLSHNHSWFCQETGLKASATVQGPRWY